MAAALSRRGASAPGSRRPQVVAHRGSSHVKAEHTLGAYLAALDEGAEGLECDVRLTADGHLVCVHDRDLRRTAQQRGVVSTMRLADLDDLDFAQWKNPWADLDDEAPEIDESHHKVLTLRKLMETVADYDRRVELAIETKHPTRYAGLVERRLVELLAEFGWAGKDAPVRVMSFSWLAMTRVRRLAPDVEVVFLLDKAYAWRFSAAIREQDWIAGPGIELLREQPRLARRMARDGLRMHVWTVNTAEDLDLCRSLGVEAVITDRPRLALEHYGVAQDERPPA
ncbi:glycerophosphodiester phosphodiesterase family protein [Nocardioides massiliensis]|uniref:Glycerophosphoryl diester phosphodiesterase n=1 Tax=Nocardioides massiliensis TaxID=1325935 RepID=A0ABT9NLC6_9ACTN|nr:glycerophosphodiester phosphodiesterase family protein [Nocardioides massiliensis]MDP9821232.1 glycerophosphoryl diester phosphodiesterase [Nocardioides massiliensis]